MNEVPPAQQPPTERIRLEDPDQVQKWSNNLGVSPAELKRIITEVGGDPDKVRAYLNTRA
jgi:hypothetical protein